MALLGTSQHVFTIYVDSVCYPIPIRSRHENYLLNPILELRKGPKVRFPQGPKIIEFPSHDMELTETAP